MGRGPNHNLKKFSQSDLGLLIRGGRGGIELEFNVGLERAQPTTYIVQDLNKKRSTRVEGPILFRKLGADQTNNKIRFSRHKFIIAGTAIGGVGPLGPPGCAYVMEDREV